MARKTSRRSFLEWAGAMGLGGTLGCGAVPPSPSPTTNATPKKKYKAAFSNAGLKATWCAHGMKTAQRWGEWLGIDIKVYDSEFSVQQQLLDVEDMAVKDWDFVCIQAYGIKTLREPVRRLIDRGIPVIDMDTRIVPEGDDIGLWTFVTPDHEKQGEEATEAIVKAMGYKGKIVHVLGALAHSGARLRAKGFRNVVERYPEIEVLAEEPADWDIEKVARIWDDWLVKFPEIDGAFLHNDDMAMAAVQAVKRSGQERDIVFGSIDAQEMGINGVVKGDLVVSVMNPAGRIHWTALMLGYFAAQGQPKTDVPDVIYIDHPVVTKDNAASYQYLMKERMI